MVTRDMAISELRARVARLTSAAADIQSRIESRSRRLASASDSEGSNDPVQDRLFWVLARLTAQREAAASRLAVMTRNAA